MRRIVRYLFLTTLIIATNLSAQLFAQHDEIYTVDKSVTGSANKFSEKNILTYRVLENNIEKYLITNELEYDVPFPALKVFSDGSSVLINSFEASLTFYNESGDEFFKSNMIKDMDVEYERSIYSAISDESLVIALKQPAMDYLLVQLYNQQGKYISEFKVSEKHLNGLSYSANMNIIALSVFGWQKDNLAKSTLFLNSNGEQITRISGKFTDGNFIEMQNLFVGYSNNNCFVYDFNNNSLNFSKSVVENEMILSAKFIDDQIILMEAKKPTLENGKWYYTNPDISLYTKNGILINKSVIESMPFTEYQLFKDETRLIFKTENKTFFIK